MVSELSTYKKLPYYYEFKDIHSIYLKKKEATFLSSQKDCAMIMTSTKSALMLGVSRLQGALTEKLHAYIEFDLKDHNLARLVACDRSMLIYSNCPVKLKQQAFEPLHVGIPGRLFSDLIKELPEGEVELSFGAKNLLVKAGEHLNFQMSLPLVEDFIPQEEFSFDITKACSFYLSGSELSQMINHTSICVNADSQKEYGGLVYLHAQKQEIRMIASDGYRLSYSQIPVKLGEAEQLGQGICFNKKALLELQKAADEVKLAQSNLHVIVIKEKNALGARLEDWAVFLQLSSVKYPHYEGVIPKKRPNRVKINRQLFLAAIKRVLVASDKGKILQLCFSNGLLTLLSRNQDSSEGKDTLWLDDYSGLDVKLFINGRFLIDILNLTQSSEVILEFSSEDQPIVLSFDYPESNFFAEHIIVPVREL